LIYTRIFLEDLPKNYATVGVAQISCKCYVENILVLLLKLIEKA